jgi:DNA mismatch repair protein MutL
MSDVIRLLPDAIANQIAAGEVIQRPASVVKELLENAVDAGATDIRVIVKDAGRTLIQIVDNGCGMSTSDARMCFEKHATSKIRKTDDLFAIRTMGFRGEALASVAAIAQVELRTRQPESEIGTRIVIEGFEVKEQEPCQHAPGTSIMVRNLFFNVPARRNFLKSNNVELRHIIDEFQRVALAHPGIFLSLHHNGVELFHLNKGHLRQRIIHLFGNNYNEKLVPIQESTSVADITGFIGKPDSARKTRGEQFFFVNNRFIRSPYLQHAVIQAYAQMLPENHYPLFVIFIDIDPTRIDVNVHPTKQEIKFEDERIIYTFIQAAAKHALAQYSIAPTLDFDQDPTFSNLPAFIHPNKEARPQPFRTMPSKMNDNNKNVFRAWEKDRQETEQSPHIVPPATFPDMDDGEARDSHGRCFQIHQRYIVAQIRSGFIVVDQQAAHERILFERYLRHLQGKQHSTQQQLFPGTMTLSTADAALLTQILPDVRQLGFDIQPFGKDTFVIHGVPPELENNDERQVLEDLLEQCKQDSAGLQLRKHEVLARSLARSNAISMGRKLSENEMRNLIDELFACSTPYLSPVGHHTFITYDMDEMAARFQNKT